MKVLITGGCGFIGQQLCRAILSRGELQGKKVEVITLLDTCTTTLDPALANDARVRTVVGSVQDRATAMSVVDSETHSVFHLAAIMSMHGEEDFDLCVSVNVDGGRNLLEACRAAGSCPRFLFTSTTAVYGPGNPVVSDSDKPAPLTTYGMTKSILELMLNEYTRRGFIDGRGARLPTVVVRPGAPNRASTSTFSSIVREPLHGVPITVPVSGSLPHPVTGTRTLISNLIKLHDIDANVLDTTLGADRVVNMPSVTVTLSTLNEATVAVAKRRDMKLGAVTWAPQADVDRVVSSMCGETDWARAKELHLDANPSLETLVEEFIDDFMSKQALPIAATVSGDRKTVGFAGLGFMGLGMATNIVKKLGTVFDIRVHNRSKDKAEAFCADMMTLFQRRVAVVDTVSDLAECDVVVICLATEDASRLALLGDDGLLVTSTPNSKPSRVVIDCATVSIELSKQCHEAAIKFGCHFLDAPISGGPEGAAGGTLAIMVGGQQQAFDMSKPILDAMGSNISLMGAAGSGTAVKLANQLLVGAHAVAASEAMLFAQRAGVADLGQMLDLLAVSWGNSKILQRVGRVVIDAETVGAGGIDAPSIAQTKAPIRLLKKDLGIVRNAYMAAGLTSLPMADTAYMVYAAECDDRGHSEFDMTVPFYTLGESPTT